MTLTAHQTRLAETIDTHVRQVLAHGGGDEALLLSMADYMPTFKQLLDTCTCWRGWPRASLTAVFPCQSDDTVLDWSMP